MNNRVLHNRNEHMWSKEFICDHFKFPFFGVWKLDFPKHWHKDILDEFLLSSHITYWPMKTAIHSVRDHLFNWLTIGTQCDIISENRSPLALIFTVQHPYTDIVTWRAFVAKIAAAHYRYTMGKDQLEGRILLFLSQSGPRLCKMVKK